MSTRTKRSNKLHSVRPVTMMKNVDKVTPKRRKKQIGVMIGGKLNFSGLAGAISADK
jgi:hypothetical protein